MDNLFYKNLALCDIATGYYFLNRLDQRPLLCTGRL